MPSVTLMFFFVFALTQIGEHFLQYSLLTVTSVPHHLRNHRSSQQSLTPVVQSGYCRALIDVLGPVGPTGGQYTMTKHEVEISRVLGVSSGSQSSDREFRSGFDADIRLDGAQRFLGVSGTQYNVFPCAACLNSCSLFAASVVMLSYVHYL